jgi:hypothetical protein
VPQHFGEQNQYVCIKNSTMNSVNALNPRNEGRVMRRGRKLENWRV